MDTETRLRTLFSRGGWRAEIEVRRNEEEQRLAAATHNAAAAGSEHETHVKAARSSLERARLAIDSKPNLIAWVTGSAITTAWESVHQAGAQLVELESDQAVRSSLPRLLDWIGQVMSKGPMRDRYETELTAIIEGKKQVDRTLVHQAHQDVLTSNNEWHANLRTFRNVLLLTGAVLVLALLVLAIWHAINPSFVSICDPNAAKGHHCFSGDSPSSKDIAAIELVGAIGGLLSIAFGLGSEKSAPSRYNVRFAQMLLKPAAGAATAVVGVLLVQSGVIVAPAQRNSETLFLAYAAVFGFSQQLLTQFVDKRAGKLLGTG